VPKSNILLGEGRGFEIAQGRLGPGRIHHCMRLAGLAERTLGTDVPSGRAAASLWASPGRATVTLERIAQARILIDQSRLLTMRAAEMMDTVGNKAARQEIAMIKVAAPNMACQIVDWAIQLFGGGGTNNVSSPGGLLLRPARLLRLADGPDEVHRNQIAMMEVKKYRGTDPAASGGNLHAVVAGTAVAARRPMTLQSSQRGSSRP